MTLTQRMIIVENKLIAMETRLELLERREQIDIPVRNKDTNQVECIVRIIKP